MRRGVLDASLYGFLCFLWLLGNRVSERRRLRFGVSWFAVYFSGEFFPRCLD
jgi:hypothetical protein